MQALIIKSPHTNEALAEIRTDGKTLLFTYDKTGGKIQKMFAKGVMAGINAIDESDSLEIISNPNVKSHTYSLTNGDTIEITSDGLTAALNGRMLSPDEFKRVHELLATGKLKVASKANLDMPNELQGIPRPVEDHVGNARQQQLNDYSLASQKLSKTELGSYSHGHDPHIEKAYFSELDQNNQKLMRKLLNDMVYGAKND